MIEEILAPVVVGLILFVAGLLSSFGDDRSPPVEIQRDIEGNVIRNHPNTFLQNDVKESGTRANVVFSTGYTDTPKRISMVMTTLQQGNENPRRVDIPPLDFTNEIRMREVYDRYKRLRESYAHGILLIKEYEDDKEFVDTMYPHVKFYIQNIKVSNEKIKEDLDNLKLYMERHSDEHI